MGKNKCPLGGDTKKNCADCVYKTDYHFDKATGECVRNSIYDKIKEPKQAPKKKAKKETREFNIRLTINSKDNGLLQLKQLLDEEKRTGYINYYRIDQCERFIVKSVAELKLLAGGDYGADCFITLNGGLRSSKHIEWLPKKQKFYVLNEIDGSEQSLTEAELFTESNIGEAIKKNALIFAI